MTMMPNTRLNNSGRPEERFRLNNVLKSLATLPRVARLVWRGSPRLMLIMAFLTLLRAVTPLANTLIIGLLIDAAIQGYAQRSITPLLLPVILQLIVHLLDRLFSTTASLCQSLLQERVSHHIQLQILRKANTLDLTFFENAEFYDTLRRASQESNTKPITMISQFFTLVSSFISLLTMLGLLLHLAWWLSVVALIIPIPAFIAGSRYSLKNYWLMFRQSAKKRLQMYCVNVLTTDEFNKEIKLFNLGPFFIERYNDLEEKIYHENERLQISQNVNNCLWSMLSILANAGIYLYVALQAVQRLISIGSLTRYTQAINQAGQYFQGVLDGLSHTYESTLFINTLFEFLAYEPKISSPTHPEPLEVSQDSQGLAIEFRNVSFTYPEKQLPALKNVSFKLHSGQTIALVGGNGAGKTTLVKLLTRLYDPDEGEILVGGRNIKEYDLAELREQIGVIFQDYIKYHLNARENIGIGRVQEVENLDLVDAAAHKSGAHTVIEHLADGYESMLGRWFTNGVQLSGGEWQKVALARAFMRDARILILDEPTSALDAQAEYEVFTRFRHLTEGKTALFISHRFSTVRLADFIIVMENGTILEYGSHTELLSLNGRYAALFNLQAEAYR